MVVSWQYNTNGLSNMTNPKRALVATHHLMDYAGSEIATLELASELRQSGWKVQIASFQIGEPMSLVFKKRGFEILDLIDDIPLILATHYDLVWIHHAPVYYQLCLANKINARKIIHSCLSPFEPLEMAPIENEQIDWILANSQETKQVIKSTIGAGDDRVLVFPNTVPIEFWGYAKNSHPKIPKQVAIVSNHPPIEVLQAGQKLADNGILVTHIGRGGVYELVTPELLLKFDILITIGKTVLYCFALRIPVYCYDHFGGPGWLTPKNLNISAEYNFSGRGFSKKSPETIFHELLYGYDNSLHNIEALALKAKEKYNLYTNLQELLNKLQKKRIKTCLNKNLNAISLQHNYYVRLLKTVKAFHEENVALHEEIANLHREIAALGREITRVKSTISWKITKPLRFFANVILGRWKKS